MHSVSTDHSNTTDQLATRGKELDSLRTSTNYFILCRKVIFAIYRKTSKHNMRKLLLVMRSTVKASHGSCIACLIFSTVSTGSSRPSISSHLLPNTLNGGEMKTNLLWKYPFFSFSICVASRVSRSTILYEHEIWIITQDSQTLRQ